MNNRKVLSLKYRPQNFSELIGQESMSLAIQNAIQMDRIPNAYLLTGIRGVGKTTTARIIAKAINCNKQFGSNETCSKEEYCHCEAIIDEVHMLSKQAFNALLKTLEEPPPHLKFILATTEVKKIPVTILSRCQRFDLRRIKVDEMKDFLFKICEKEKADVDDNSLSLIAKSSEGSVRDALSILDQSIITYNLMGAKVTEDKVREMLGLADTSKIIDLMTNVVEGNVEKSVS